MSIPAGSFWASCRYVRRWRLRLRYRAGSADDSRTFTRTHTRRRWIYIADQEVNSSRCVEMTQCNYIIILSFRRKCLKEGSPLSGRHRRNDRGNGVRHYRSGVYAAGNENKSYNKKITVAVVATTNKNYTGA